MATLKMLDPRASVNTKDRPVVPGLDTLEGKVIGIIDNGQANSTTMFQELATLLQEKYRPAEVLFKTKPTHMQGAPKATMEEFVSRCDAVITGLGSLRVVYIVECPRRDRTTEVRKADGDFVPVDFHGTGSDGSEVLWDLQFASRGNPAPSERRRPAGRAPRRRGGGGG